MTDKTTTDTANTDIEIISRGGSLHYRCSERIGVGSPEGAALCRIGSVQKHRPVSASASLARYDGSNDYAWFTANSHGGWTSHDPIFRVSKSA